MSSGPMPQPMMVPSPYYGMPPMHIQQQQQQNQQQQQQQQQQHGPGQQQQQQQQPSYYHYPVTHHYPPAAPMMMTTTAATMTINSTSGGGGGFTISHDEVMLLQKLKHQIDWYFSPKNLKNDTYLLNQLNATDHLGAVSVETICNFPKIRELVHTFYTTRMGYMVPPGPPPVAPPHLIQTALRLDLSSSSTTSTSTSPDATRTEIVTLSDDGLWISPTSKKHAVPGQNRQNSNATAVTVNTVKVNDTDRSNSNNSSGISSNGHNNDNSNSKANDEPQSSSSSLTMINGNINGKEVSDDNNKNSSNEGGTPTSGGGASVPTMSTGISTAPSSPSSQASSVGVRTYPLPQPQRNVVIVRDIPSEAKVDDVIEALSTLSIKPKSARPDIGNTWYVTFESEEHAVSALAQANDKKIAGAPILGRLKSESAPAAKPGGLSTISKSEGSHNVTPTSTGATGNPPPIAMLPPSVNGTENDDSVTESISSSVRSANSRVASHPGTHVVQNQYPVYPPMMQHQQMVGMPPPFAMPPNQGYGFPPGAPHQMYAMHYFPPQQMGSYPGGMPQRYVPQYQYHPPQHANARNWHPHHHPNSRHHQRQSGSQGSSSRSKQQQQQQQNAQKRQQQTRVSTQSVSSATDHSQLDGSQRHTSSLTPPEHVFLKNKDRDTIDGSSSTKIPKQLRVSNNSQQNDQLGPRPPTQKKNSKKKPGKKTGKNKQVPPTNPKVKPSGRDSDTMSVGSRNSRRSSSSNNNNGKRNTAQNKKKNTGTQHKKDTNHRTASNDRGKGGKSGQPKKDESTTGKQTSKNGKQKKESTRPDKKSGSRTVINVSDFPALGGRKADVGKSGIPTNDASKQGPRTTGYAQALLKTRTDASSKNNTEKPASSET